MKSITLHKLILQNFQGGTFRLDADGADADVYGANAAGKTRLASAFSWLLFGKDSLGRADFQIKNLDSTGEQEHGLDHAVEAVLSVNGKTATLKKVYRELWTKKRGSAERTFTGNTVDHFIDGVPSQEKEYKAYVAELAGDESVFRLLTSPTAFPALHWQKQRALLLEVCGDLTDRQVIESDSKLMPLVEILTNRSLEDHRKVIAARRSEINKQLEQLPVRIDEVRRGLPDVSGLHRPAVEAEVQTLEAKLNDEKLRLQGIDTGGRIAALTKELNAIDSELSNLQNKHYLSNMEKVTKLNQQLREMTAEVEDGMRKFNAVSDEIERKQKQMETNQTLMASLRQRWGYINSETFHDTTEDVCPACGQSLPSDRVQEAREKALAAFNEDKAERMQAIQVKGKGLADENKNLQAAIDRFKDSCPSVDLREDELKSLIAARDAAKAFAEDYANVEGRQEILEKKAVAESALRIAKDSVADDRSAVTEEIEGIAAMLKEAREKADRFVRREAGEKRIEELKAEEKKLAKEFEELEKQLFLCESFVKTKVRLLTERINAKFEFVRFKLFNQLVNGGIEDCCVLTINGVPYDSGLNSAARTQGGLDIVRTLQAHYGIAPVVWIDNRESCTEIPGMGCQVISLYVSPEDRVLRVERAVQEQPARRVAGRLL